MGILILERRFKENHNEATIMCLECYVASEHRLPRAGYERGVEKHCCLCNRWVHEWVSWGNLLADSIKWAEDQ